MNRYIEATVENVGNNGGKNVGNVFCADITLPGLGVVAARMLARTLFIACRHSLPTFHPSRRYALTEGYSLFLAALFLAAALAFPFRLISRLIASFSRSRSRVSKRSISVGRPNGFKNPNLRKLPTVHSCQYDEPAMEAAMVARLASCSLGGASFHSRAAASFQVTVACFSKSEAPSVASLS